MSKTFEIDGITYISAAETILRLLREKGDMEMEIITRAQYMAGEVDHETYYSQFVTYGVLQLVRTIKQAILRSKDPHHFSDIPLKRWDRMAGALPSDALSLHKLADRGGISQCDRVCILKAAARRIRKEADAGE